MLIKIKGFFPVKFKTYIKKFRKYNAYHQLDKKLLKYINYKNGFYIDCGANDGVNQSTTWYFEKYLNWNGILIEPIPNVFNELKKNRSKSNYFYNTALTDFNYNSKTIKFNLNKEDTLTGSIFSNNQFLKNIQTIKVKATTLDQIIKKDKSDKLIDLFSLDVEGYEFEVLNGINFDNIKFKFLLIETEFPEKLINYMSKKNYTFVERLSNYNFSNKPTYGDYLFKGNFY
jgi:FkbM family methyltransferase|tara:strand:- start:710 stop:1396 length:687 start_codon:yes stop_codon:yes gene_type:complete